MEPTCNSKNLVQATFWLNANFYRIALHSSLTSTFLSSQARVDKEILAEMLDFLIFTAYKSGLSSAPTIYRGWQRSSGTSPQRGRDGLITKRDLNK